MLKTINQWVSDNGNYMVKATEFTHDDGFVQVDVKCLKRDVRGKYVIFHGQNLPKYVLEKIVEMRREIRK